MTRLWSIFRGVDSSPLGLPMFFISCFFVALLELITVAVIPLFVAIVVTPDIVTDFVARNFGSQSFLLLTPLDLIILTGSGIALFLAFRAGISLAVGLYQNRVISRYQTQLSSNMVISYLHWPYEDHLQINSSELIRNSVSVPTSISTILLCVGIVATEIALALSVAAILIVYQPLITLCALGVVGATVGTLFIVFRRRLGHLGKEVNAAAVETMKWLNQTLGGLKEIRVADRPGFFHDHYIANFFNFSRLTLETQFLVQAPRLFMELIAITAMILLAVFLIGYGNPDDVLPTMALFGAASLRLMPSANRIWNAVASIRANMAYVDIYLADTAHDREPARAIGSDITLTLDRQLTVSGLTYHYPGSDRAALKDISLEIVPGQTVGIAGRSGAGKSTLLDILLGLHHADGGGVFVDGVSVREHVREWRRMIGYVPQQIFLLDDTVRRNVALGETDNEIDEAGVVRALDRANLSDVINALPAKLDSTLGERGARLSGGQRQRIGIARALYRNPRILFLDEATSALDKETELAVAETLRLLHGQVTIVIIAHHEATMGLCDKIFVLDEGRLSDVGTPGEIQARNSILK